MSGKKLRITFNSPFILCFALACTLVMLLGLLTGESSTATLFSTYGASWREPLTYVRLFTHVLGHAGLVHLINNMAYILLLGPQLEEKYGWKILLLVILATALVTGIIHSIFSPRTMLLGASGVAFAFILLTSFTEFKEGEMPNFQDGERPEPPEGMEFKEGERPEFPSGDNSKNETDNTNNESSESSSN